MNITYYLLDNGGTNTKNVKAQELTLIFESQTTTNMKNRLEFWYKNGPMRPHAINHYKNGWVANTILDAKYSGRLKIIH